jgi:hypothetical protein
MEEHSIPDYEKLYIEEKNRRNELEKENQNLLVKIKLLKNNQNKGEKDEVLLLMELFELNERKEYNKLVDIFGEEACDGIMILNINTKKEILDISELCKAKGEFKADSMIEMKKTGFIYCISIKSKNGANPAILNHTPRSAKVFNEGGILYDSIDSLDNIVMEYIEKREKKIIGEDTSIKTLESLNDTLMENKFMDVLTYFVFDGSGKGDSKCKANAIITYEGETITFIKCVSIEEKIEYIRTIYDRIIISLRDKGMPKVINDGCKKWVFNDSKMNGLIKYKGSLHIRMK